MQSSSTICSLDTHPIAGVLSRLHGEARADLVHMPGVVARELLARVTGRTGGSSGMSHRFRKLRISLGPEAGRLAYLVGRTIGARTVVEFGTSFAISTIYLAAAVKDNGGGRVIGTELEESKWRIAQKNLADAGLGDIADVRLGDALETLGDLPAGGVDLVLLDGWKDLYLPVLKLVEPSLRPGAVVLADNIKMFKKALGPYVRYVQSESGRYASTTLSIGSGLEYSVYRPGGATST